MSNKVEDVGQVLSDLLDNVREFFARPDETKVTLIVRCPWEGDANILLTNDDAAGMEAALADFKARWAEADRINADGYVPPNQGEC